MCKNERAQNWRGSSYQHRFIINACQNRPPKSGLDLGTRAGMLPGPSGLFYKSMLFNMFRDYVSNTSSWSPMAASIWSRASCGPPSGRQTTKTNAQAGRGREPERDPGRLTKRLRGCSDLCGSQIGCRSSSGEIHTPVLFSSPPVLLSSPVGRARVCVVAHQPSRDGPQRDSLVGGTPASWP